MQEVASYANTQAPVACYAPAIETVKYSKFCDKKWSYKYYSKMHDSNSIRSQCCIKWDPPFEQINRHAKQKRYSAVGR